MRNDVEARYYQAREKETRALSEATIDPAVRAIHLEMAKRYAVLAGARVDPRSRHG